MVIFYVILAALILGVGTWLTAKHKMHWTAFAVAAVVSLLLPLPVNAIGLAIAKSDQQTFNEYYNGFETAATSTTVECERDGDCENTYSCDPYVVMEAQTYTDSNGNTQTRMVPKTYYHSCPYSERETSYFIETTLQTFTAGANLMTGAPYRLTKGIPGGQVTEAPKLWLDAEARLKAGKPGGVTTVNRYTNFILGSEQSLFRRYSDLIEELKGEALLPPMAQGVTDLYQAPKAHFIGDLAGVDRDALLASLTQLNGAVGTELRGDLHAVFVDASEVSASPEDYSNALLAYWQSKEEFGRNALSKNAIVLVIGVAPYEASAAPADSTEAPAATSIPTASPSSTAPAAGATVPIEVKPEPKVGEPAAVWARAFTGMPVGNESLLQELRSSITGTVVDQNLFGTPVFDVKSGEVKHSDGLVEDILWGANRFERVSMDAKDADDNGSGFGYLKDAWQPDSGTLAWIYSIAGILSLAALIGGALMARSMRENRTNDFVRHLFTGH